MKSVNIKVYLLGFMLLIFVGAYAQQSTNNNKNKESVMSTSQKKEIIRMLFEESLNKRNMQLLHDLFSPEYTGPQGEKGAAGFEAPVNMLITAFPDIQWKIEELIGDGEKVAVRWTWQGTHVGQFTNFAATGKTITNTAIAIFSFRDDKIIKADMQTDRLGFLQEIEVVPRNLTSLSNKKATADKANLIDKFFVPAAAKKEFYERMHINREFIKQLPGFLEDAAYEYTDKNGNLICVTVAQWQNIEAINKAKEAVQAEYKKQGFDMGEMVKRLNIVVDRGIYKDIEGN